MSCTYFGTTISLWVHLLRCFRCTSWLSHVRLPSDGLPALLWPPGPPLVRSRVVEALFWCWGFALRILEALVVAEAVAVVAACCHRHCHHHPHCRSRCPPPPPACHDRRPLCHCDGMSPPRPLLTSTASPLGRNGIKKTAEVQDLWDAGDSVMPAQMDPAPDSLKQLIQTRHSYSATSMPWARGPPQLRGRRGLRASLPTPQPLTLRAGHTTSTAGRLKSLKHVILHINLANPVRRPFFFGSRGQTRAGPSSRFSRPPTPPPLICTGPKGPLSPGFAMDCGPCSPDSATDVSRAARGGR